MQWKQENDVDDFVQVSLETIGLVKLKDFNVQNGMSEYMRSALQGAAKTKDKTKNGTPDFHCERYNVPVVIENKLHLKKLINENKEGVKQDFGSVENYAVNGALHYAQVMIRNGKYSEVIAVGVAGDNKDNVEMRAYFVFGSHSDGIKYLPETKTFDFLASQDAFETFYESVKLNENDKQQILTDSKEKLSKHAAKLNKLMHNHNITAGQRVLYVSGMLLAMQNINVSGKAIKRGIKPDELEGFEANSYRDGVLIVNQIKTFLEQRQIETEKRSLMMASFAEISKDPDRDIKTKLDKEVAKFINGEASANKQIFTFIYEYIYKSIDSFGGHLDIMGELYSEFLKYALGDGKEIGIVLTPPYVTKMMAEILNINQDSRVMDLATGSAGFLISAMELMIGDAEKQGAKGSPKTQDKIQTIKEEQLLGVELNAEMYTLATTNMILRGDGASKIQKANTFNTPPGLYENFKADRLLLNPPFSYDENGMPFIQFGLNNMNKGGLGAIIIQDSAGSGKAVKTNTAILKRHTLKASIKMPTDLFQPMAGVQTSIYVFEAGMPHDFDNTVKFIDFRHDGYKRTSRALQQVDSPVERYHDIVKIYKAGLRAEVQANWQLDNIFIEDKISDSGADWNFDQHKKVDTRPTLQDFKKTVGDYLAWEVSNLLKKQNEDVSRGKQKAHLAKKLECVKWGEYKLEDLFESSNGDFDIQKKHINNSGFYVITAGITNNGIMGRTSVNAKVFNKNTITIDMFGFAFFRQFKYKVVTHARVFVLNPKFNITKNRGLFIVNALYFLSKKFGYDNMCSWDKVKNETIQLPVLNGQIDFDFMENVIEELEAERIEELEAYLRVTGLKDYHLNKDEINAILSVDKDGSMCGGGGLASQFPEFNDKREDMAGKQSSYSNQYDVIEWKEFNLGDLFNKIIQGRRLKKDNQIAGSIPFVMSGVTNSGVINFISNPIACFPRNSITADIFGNVFYRNYNFGAGDDTGVYWSDKHNYSKETMLFFATSMACSLKGKYSFGKKLRSSQSKNIRVNVIVKNNDINYYYMNTLVAAIQKLVIKDVVLWANKRISATKKIIQGKSD